MICQSAAGGIATEVNFLFLFVANLENAKKLCPLPKYTSRDAGA